MNILRRRVLSVTLLLEALLTPLAMCGQNKNIVAWQSFEYVARNIFVKCTVSGPSGSSVEAEFIIDTGLNRTTVDTMLAEKLGLVGGATSRTHSPGGAAIQPTADLPFLQLGNHDKVHLNVLVEDLDRFRRQYAHSVDGFLGTDFLSDVLLSLDISKRRFSLDGSAAFGEPLLLDLDATPFSGLLLAPVTLPNRLTMLVIIDTGADFPTDFAFYDDSLYDVDFHATSVSTSGDAISTGQPVLHGTIDSVLLGDLAIPQTSVTRLPTPRENPYGTQFRPGLLTCQFFEHYLVQINFPGHRLRLNASR